jgi:hypothetical protein
MSIFNLNNNDLKNLLTVFVTTNAAIMASRNIQDNLKNLKSVEDIKRETSHWGWNNSSQHQEYAKAVRRDQEAKIEIYDPLKKCASTFIGLCIVMHGADALNTFKSGQYAKLAIIALSSTATGVFGCLGGAFAGILVSTSKSSTLSDVNYTVLNATIALIGSTAALIAGASEAAGFTR